MSCSQADVRQIAMTLPGVSEGRDGFGFGVEAKGKVRGFVWAWRKRVHPKQPKVAQADVIAVRVANQEDKATLLAADSDKFFTEDHYNGYPAVLVRLDAVSRGELAQVLVEAWRCMAPKALVEAYDVGAATPIRAKPAAKATPAAKAKPAKATPAKAKPAAKRKPTAKPKKPTAR